MDRFFGIRAGGSSIGREVMGGITTFLAMAYIVAVNPGILAPAGLPKAATAVATSLAAAGGTLFMGLYARRPLALAPYMGENAFFAFTVVLGLKYSWQQGLAATLMAGALFAVLTLTGLRGHLARAVPHALRHSFVVGIGLFLAFIGLQKIGFITHGTPGAETPPVALGTLADGATMLGIAGFVIMGLFVLWRIPGGVLLAIVIIYGASIMLGVAPRPEAIARVPDFKALSAIASLWPVTGWHLDFSGFAEAPFWLAVFLPIFLMAFFDTIGTLIGVCSRAGLLDAKGDLAEIEKPLLCDALATMWGALVGTTTTGAYIESAAGVQAGARTGLASVVTGVLFLAALFFVPAIEHIPPCAYAPALILVGILMMESVQRLDFGDFTELVPAFTVITVIPFTFNIGVGMAAGFVVHPLLKLLTGRARETSAGGWVFAAASLLFFACFPYGK